MQSVGTVALGLCLLVAQAALPTLVPVTHYIPNLLLPIAIFLGVSPEVSLVRGSTICFVLGYLYDAFCGSPMGLQTFVLVASFMVARGAGLRLFPQGPAFQILLTAIMALLSGGTILALRAIFERPPPFPSSDAFSNLWTVVRYSLMTAILSPLVFAFTRRLERAAHRGEPRSSEVL